MPRSRAVLRRSARTRSSRSPPRAGSTRSTRSGASSSSSGSTAQRLGDRVRRRVVARGRRRRAARSGRATGAGRAGVVRRRRPEGREQEPPPATRKGSFGIPGTRHRPRARRRRSAAPRGAGTSCRDQVVADVPLAAVDRVTMTPVATDISSAGICETRPSPTDEQAVGADRLARGHALLQHADREAADQVDQRDDHGGDGVALDELGATVHGAVEVGLGGDLLAAPAGLVLVDEPGVEVGVDRHLLAGHRVEGEPRPDLGDPGGTVGDDGQLDDDEDREDDQADDQRAADDDVPERVDDVPGVPVAQHQPGRGDVERQPQDRADQDERREDRELQRLAHLHRHEQDHEATSRCSPR